MKWMVCSLLGWRTAPRNKLQIKYSSSTSLTESNVFEVCTAYGLSHLGNKSLQVPIKKNLYWHENMGLRFQCINTTDTCIETRQHLYVSNYRLDIQSNNKQKMFNAKKVLDTFCVETAGVFVVFSVYNLNNLATTIVGFVNVSACACQTDSPDTTSSKLTKTTNTSLSLNYWKTII